MPSYLAEQGLKDFADIAKFRDQLDGKIYGIEPGNDGNRLILKMIEDNAFGLERLRAGRELGAGHARPGGARDQERGADRVPRLGAASDERQFRPHLSVGRRRLFGPDYGGATVYTNVRAGYLEECPNVGQLLKNQKFTLEMENQIMGAILDDGEAPEDAAQAWLKEHPEVLDAWLEGVTTLDGEPALPAVKEHLGIS